MMDVPQDYLEAIKLWRNFTDDQFVVFLQESRETRPAWWILVDFRYHVDIEIRLRSLLK